MGIALLPKAGLVIGLALLAKEAFPTFGEVLFNGVLASVIINIFVTPILAIHAIQKSHCRFPSGRV